MDILGPDMGTNEQVMAWFMDSYSVHAGYALGEIVTGKPVSLGGVAGRRESPGRGVVFLIDRALDHLKIPPSRCTAIVQGFGNVGSVTAGGLAFKSGMKVVGISDHTTSIYDPKGIDIAAADRHVAHNGTFMIFPWVNVWIQRVPDTTCDVLVPAAVERVITRRTPPPALPHSAEAANGPTTRRLTRSQSKVGGDLSHPRHSVQFGWSHRLLLRMGAGPAEFSVVRHRDRQSALPDPRQCLHRGYQAL